MNGFLHIARDWILRWLSERGGSSEINMSFNFIKQNNLIKNIDNNLIT